MSNNVNEVKEYIYKNYTPMDIQKAIQYYHERTGADLATSKLEVEKIYEQRKQAGMELPMPKEWTPNGQKYRSGKTMFDLGIVFLVMGILFMIIFPIFAYSDTTKRINEISESDRQNLLDKGCQEYRTDGEAFEIIRNYDRENFKKLYLFQPERDDELCLGVISDEWWYHFDSDIGSGLDIFYVGAPVLDNVETKDGSSYEVMVVDLQNVVAGYGIPSENGTMLKLLSIILPTAACSPIVIAAVVLIIIGRKKMKNSEIM